MMTKAKKFDPLERQEIPEIVRRFVPGEMDGPLSDFIEYLRAAGEEAMAQGWYGLHVETDWYYEDCTIYIRAWRLETDEEYGTRQKAERELLAKKVARQKKSAEAAAKKLAKTEAEQRALYEQLKEKFGG